MKKTKLLALTLVAVIMLVGAGYAAWTEVIKTDTIITTGELSVEIVPGKSSASYDKGIRNMAGKGYIEPLKDYIDANVSADGVQFTLENLYPGATATTSFRMENQGTMAAFIIKSRAKIEGDVDKHLYNAIEVDYLLTAEKEDGTIVRLEKGTTNLSNLNNLFYSDGGPMVGNYVGVNEELECELTFTIPRDSLKGNDGERESLGIELYFDFVQPNQFLGRVKTH